jgi:hypothetical protein
MADRASWRSPTRPSGKTRISTSQAHSSIPNSAAGPALAAAHEHRFRESRSTCCSRPKRQRGPAARRITHYNKLESLRAPCGSAELLEAAGPAAVRPMVLRTTYCLVKASFALSATKEPAKTRRIHASTRGRLMTWSLTAAANAP